MPSFKQTSLEGGSPRLVQQVVVIRDPGSFCPSACSFLSQGHKVVLLEPWLSICTPGRNQEAGKKGKEQEKTHEAAYSLSKKLFGKSNQMTSASILWDITACKGIWKMQTWSWLYCLPKASQVLLISKKGALGPGNYLSLPQGNNIAHLPKYEVIK